MRQSPISLLARTFEWAGNPSSESGADCRRVGEEGGEGAQNLITHRGSLRSLSASVNVAAAAAGPLYSLPPSSTTTNMAESSRSRCRPRPYPAPLLSHSLPAPCLPLSTLQSRPHRHHAPRQLLLRLATHCVATQMTLCHRHRHASPTAYCNSTHKSSRLCAEEGAPHFTVICSARGRPGGPDMKL